MSHRYPRQTLCGLVVASLLLAAFGCGTGAYEERMKAGFKKAAIDAKFGGLYGPQDLAESPMAVRVPKFFTASPFVEGAVVDGKRVGVRRVKPGAFDFPGLKLTYEALFDDGQGGKLPCYCYVGTIPAAGVDLAAAILAAINAKVPFPEPPTWFEVPTENPEGAGPTYKKLRVSYPQEFYSLKNGQEQYVQLQGMLEVFLCEDSGHYILIAWRLPDSIEAAVDLAKYGPIVAGCSGIKKPKP